MKRYKSLYNNEGYNSFGYDREGYDRDGFNHKGIHRETGTYYNPEGYSKKGYDQEGYDREGYNIKGYDRQGYNRKGFSRDRRHKLTGTRYDLEGYDYLGYDKSGYDRRGFNIKGYNIDGYNIEGYDLRGFDQNGIHSETGTEYDLRGFNRHRIHKDTGTEFDSDGFSFLGYNEDGYDREGYDSQGYGKDGYDKKGYNKRGYDKDGYNTNGYNEQGYHKITGFNIQSGIHKETGTPYNPEGYNRDGYDKEGYYYDGYDRKGFSREGYDRSGFDRDGYDRDGYDKSGIDKLGYGKDGLHIEGYNEEGYDKRGYDRNGVSKVGISRLTGQKDDRVQLAEEFIVARKSIEQFAKEKQISVESVKAIIEVIRTSPCIKEKIDEVLTSNSNRYLTSLKVKKQQLLSGTKTIKEISGINDVLRICDTHERQKITELLITEMASHEISILDYKYILGIEKIDANLPQNIITQIDAMKKSAGRLSRELYKEIDRIKPYRTQYKAAEGETIGFFANPTDKEPVKFTITDTQRDMARQYLRATGEFICNKTMQATLMKIVKGELDIEKIERAKKEGELRSLQQEDAELTELIEQSEQFIENNMEVTR